MATLSTPGTHTVTLVDGVPADSFPCSDRGLAYGDGLFETIALVDGEPRHWERHMARLRTGADRLAIPCPTAEIWREDLRTLLDADAAPGVPANRMVLKLMLTRGSGPRGYAPQANPTPRRLVQLAPWPAGSGETLARVILCTTPLARSPLLAGLKHLNRLEQVLAAREVVDAGAEEGLMLDTAGELIAGTRGNVFLLEAGTLRTPPLEQAGICGIMREVILETAASFGLRAAVEPLGLPDLQQCEGLIFTNSLRGAQVVEQLDLPGDTRILALPTLLALRDGLRQRRLAP